MSQTQRTPERRGFSPLAKAVLGGATIGGAALLFSLRGCGEGERPRLGARVEATTTTTKPERKIEKPWYEKFGWDRDVTLENAREHLNRIVDGTEGQSKVAAGRCIVTLYDGGQENYYSVIKNPIVVSSEYKGVKFTTFIGINPYKPLREKEGDLYYGFESVSVVDGEVFWGNFGIIPGQIDVVDTSSNVHVAGGNPLPDDPNVYFKFQNTIDYQLPIGPEGYRVGEVLRIKEDRLDIVAKHCLSPASQQALPPESAR